jgi:hypothetical protein
MPKLSFEPLLPFQGVENARAIATFSFQLFGALIELFAAYTRSHAMSPG